MDVTRHGNATRKRGRVPGPKAEAGSGQIQSLTRGLTLLERLAEAGSGLLLTDLAQRVGLSPSTTHRLLTTLERAGFVRQMGELGRWYMGLKAFVVGSAFLESRDLLAQSHPYLRRLMEQSGETANLAVLDGFEAVFVDQVQCREMMRMQVKLGSRVPLHASGVGKALLSTMSDDAVRAVLHKRGLPRITDNTIDSPDRLWAELEKIRTAGYAYDNEEHAIGLRCLAAPILDEFGEPLAALSMAGPRSRVPDERAAELGALVSRLARELSQALGGEPRAGKIRG